MPEREDWGFQRNNGLPCYGNMFVRQQYYGSMELLAPVVEQSGPVPRKVGRFRVEPSRARDVKQVHLFYVRCLLNFAIFCLLCLL